jgi:hypothetical protein
MYEYCSDESGFALKINYSISLLAIEHIIFKQ